MQSKFSASAAPELRPANEGRGPFNPLAHLGMEEELPPPETKRWVIRRKAVVVAAVRSGLISLEEACERYKLSIEEFLSWQRLIDSHGLAGLRVTRLQDYRGAGKGR
jgi:hypothetical protein